MHPEIRRAGPGHCPICGMALESEMPTLEEEKNPELVDFGRRFWWTLPLTLAVVAIALLWLIVVWIRWQSIRYTLTDQRIKLESGVFSRSEKIIPIDRIQDCTTRQSLVGRILGYGRVEVDAAGAQGAEVLLHLPRPGRFRDQVFVQSERRRGVVPSSPAQTSGV